MAWKPDIWKAKKLHDKNAKKAEKLKKGFKQLRSRANRLDARYSEALRRHFDEEIAPFAELFARIKNVDLEEVQITRAVPEMRSMRPEALRVSLGAVKGMVSIAGGAAAGVGASALTFAAVGAFAAASTGTAIASLSGAAATSATLAWLGGGSLAAGGLGVAGGTAVLTGIVVLPAVLAAGWWIWWQGGKELAKQKQARAEIKVAAKLLATQTTLIEALELEAARVEEVLDRLGRLTATHNEDLERLLGECDDFTAFTTDQRQSLMLHIALVVAMTSVMSTQLLTKTGQPNPEMDQSLKTAEAVLGS